MKIRKIFNNNAVLAEDDSGNEFVVLGKGIGFGKTTREMLDTTLIKKTFSYNKNPFTQRLTEMISEIPQEYFRLTHLIVEHAKHKLDKPLSENIYITLPDHLYYAVQRFQNQQIINNRLLFEIKRLYKKEYKIGKYAIAQIKHDLGIDLGEDEAGFIALHIYNARTDANATETIRSTQIVHDILDLVSQHFNLILDEDSLDYARFITHLQYFALRLFKPQEQSTVGDDALYKQIKASYPDAYQCVENVKHYLSTEFGKSLNQDEQLYLTIHIQRVVLEWASQTTREKLATRLQ